MLKDNQVFLIPPIVFEGKIYILNDKKLYFVLCEINKLSNYLQFIRDEGYQQTYRWLKKNQLLNENFLDNVSRYWLENNNFNKTYKYEIFYKDKDYKPVIPQDFWNQYFQKVLIYDFLCSQKDEFNEFVLNNLKIISIELHNIKTLKDLDIRRKFYQNNIYNYLINNYIDHKGVDLKKITGNIDLLMSAEISNENLGLYKVGGIRSFSNYKFIRNDVKYYECVKEGTELKLELNSDLYNLKYLLNKVRKNLHQAKIEFDRTYIFKILDEDFKNACNQEITTSINYM
jgi:hypothetical protein